jgi:Rrf2 family protein
MTYSLAFSQAILVALYVADKVEQGMFEFIPTSQLSDDLNLSPSSTGSILRRFNSAGLIETREGAKGGVRLAIPPSEVTILHIFDAIEGGKSLFLNNIKMRVTGEKPTRANQAIAKLFLQAEESMKAQLKATTIADLMAILNE